MEVEYRCEFLNDTENVVQAIIRHHRRLRFLSTIELVNALEQEKLNGKQGRLANRLVHVDLLILDGKQWDGLLLTLSFRRRCARMVIVVHPFRE